MATLLKNQNYEFSAQPRAIKSRAKYRETGLQDDRTPLLSKNVEENQTHMSIISDKMSRGYMRSRERERERENERPSFYEDLELPPEDEKRVAPYFYIDKPPTPEFKPKEPGVDISTQVDDYELFDFLIEVEPILQVIVGKTLEQANIELTEELELENERKHKMHFEKLRNAELMITQRKEGEHFRKQAEIKRRQLEHEVQKKQLEQTHMKFLSKMIAKNTLSGLKESRMTILQDLGFLRHEFLLKLKKDYVPLLLSKTATIEARHKEYSYLITNVASEIQIRLKKMHEFILLARVERKKQIAEEIEAAKLQKEIERAARREKKKKLRVYVAKKQFKDNIQNVAINSGKEIEDIFTADICDYTQTPPGPSIGTLGGFLGELWLILSTLAKYQNEFKNLDYLTRFLTKFLNERYRQEKLELSLDDQAKPLIEEILKRINEDPEAFNKNKQNIIEEFVAKLPNAHTTTNSLIYQNKLLDNEILKIVNLALFNIYFTIKNPKAENLDPNQENDHTNSKSVLGTEASHGRLENVPSDQDNPHHEEKKEHSIEDEMGKARERLKLNFVPSLDEDIKFDAVARFRIPLNKPSQKFKGEGNNTGGAITMESIEKEALRPDGTIEPFDGSTFERNLAKYHEIPSEDIHSCKAINMSLIQNKVAHFNKKGQLLLRKSLLLFIKENMNEMSNFHIEDILKEANKISNVIEKDILSVIRSREIEIPVFDYEI